MQREKTQFTHTEVCPEFIRNRTGALTSHTPRMTLRIFFMTESFFSIIAAYFLGEMELKAMA